YILRILLVEQGDPKIRRYVVDKLICNNYRLTLINELNAVWDKQKFDKVILTRLSNWPYIMENVIKEHETEKFEGVLCFNEGSIPLANKIAKLLNLPLISKYSGDSFRFKDRMRVAFESYGVISPDYKILNSRKEMYALKDWEYPLVLKPSALMGSLGVVKVNSYEELPKKINYPLCADFELNFDGEIYALSEMYSLPSTVLAEEYIDGKEYSVEGFVFQEEFYPIGITKKFIEKGPFFNEKGHIFPDTS